MRTIEKEVFTYDELDERAKERALELFSASVCTDLDDYQHTLDDAEHIASLIGIDLDVLPSNNPKAKGRPCIYWSGFYSQGDGASFEGTYRYKSGALKAIKDFAPHDNELHRIAKSLQEVQRRFFYKLEARVKARNSRHTMDIDVTYVDDMWRDVSSAESEISTLLHDFADWIYDRLRDEYEYRTSREVLEEDIRFNEYEFYEDGEWL